MSKAVPTPYPELNNVLLKLVDSVQEVLGNNFVGAYLQGSFAVGDFDAHSDVDFIIVIEKELSSKQVQSLQEVHEQIYRLDSSWAQHLEGSYFPKEVLRYHDHTDKQLWYLDNGSRVLIQSNHCNTVLVRCVIREKGVTLVGPSPATLVKPIPVETLRKAIMATIHNWGQEITTNPEHFNNRFYQSFIVLSYCRMLHDLIRGFPGSKRAGAEWAKTNLDPSWTGLIDRTWAGRPNPEIPQPADPKDFKDTLKFVEYSRNKANTLYAEINKTH
ncbi:MAG: hypothetical protein NVS4B11_26060 [Ktedonobacteraceae bacterium]